MNKYILKAIFKDFFSSKTQLFVTTLTYYVMVTFIPCFILCNQILKLLGLSSDKSIGITLGLKEISPIVTISILLFSLTLISRLFYIVSKEKSKFKNNIFASISLGVLTIFFTFIFTLIFSIKATLLRYLLIYIFTLFILVILNKILDKNSLVFSFVFSPAFSLIIMAFFSFFNVASDQFLNYENYYGILAPLFLFILEVNLMINLIYLNHLFSSLYTKIAKIKIARL